MLLSNKVAIVTGGNSGIGRAVVLELARQGAKVVIDYISHPEATATLEQVVKALGSQAIGVAADVSKVADLKKLIATESPHSSTAPGILCFCRMSATRIPSLLSTWCGLRCAEWRHVPPTSYPQQGKLIEGVGGLRVMDDVGIKVRKMKHLKLHGKMLLADGVRAIVGSINLAPGSFDSRRELAIEVRDDEVVGRLHTVVHRDWKHSHPLDLSDAGLLADLEERQGVEGLAIGTSHKKKRSK